MDETNVKNLDNDKKYYIGLDIGTNSVGIAMTDQDYNLLDGSFSFY